MVETLPFEPIPKFTMYPLVGLAVASNKRVLAHEILGSPFDPAAQLTKNILSVKTLLSPLSREQIGLARCLGLNYADHAVRNVFEACVSSLALKPSFRPRLT